VLHLARWGSIQIHITGSLLVGEQIANYRAFRDIGCLSYILTFCHPSDRNLNSTSPTTSGDLSVSHHIFQERAVVNLTDDNDSMYAWTNGTIPPHQVKASEVGQVGILRATWSNETLFPYVYPSSLQHLMQFATEQRELQRELQRA
jgi:hypothetical protein